MPVVELDVREIRKRKADERGRINLGADYADEDVPVAILRDDGDGE